MSEPDPTQNPPTAPLGPSGPLAGDPRQGRMMFLASLPGGAPPMLKGDLQVTVNDDKGAAIEGVTVTVTSPSETRTGTTDASGQFLFASLAPDAYTVAGAKTGYTNGTASNITVAPGVGSSGTPAATAQLTMSLITVTITLPAPVACPGHLFEMDVAGTPAGGTFTWSATGAALTDSGSTPTTTGPQVFLASFQPDNTNGNIPSQTVNVTVTYAVGGGSASANQTVTVHAINFTVTNLTVQPGVTMADESDATSLTLGRKGQQATVLTKPTVQIQLDSSCPRQADCATHYVVGWLQTVRSNKREGRYSDSLFQTTVPTPIRDAVTTGPNASTTVPFYSVTQTFAGNNDQKVANHNDSPKLTTTWLDTRTSSPAPTDLNLRTATLSNEFTAWLVVQSIEWENNHQNQSFVFLRNFDWSVNLSVTVDMTKPLGTRCTPPQSTPAIQPVGTGQGSQTPVFTAANPNTARIISLIWASHLP